MPEQRILDYLTFRLLLFDVVLTVICNCEFVEIINKKSFLAKSFILYFISYPLFFISIHTLILMYTHGPLTAFRFGCNHTDFLNLSNAYF